MDEIEYIGATSTIQSYNLFTYCEGNPIIYGDSEGSFRELYMNSLNFDLFSRVGGSGSGDNVYSGNIEEQCGVSFTVQAKTGIIRLIQNIKNFFAKDKTEKQKEVINDNRDNYKSYDTLPPSPGTSEIEINPGVNLDNSHLYVDYVHNIFTMPHVAANNSIENYNYYKNSFKSFGMMGDLERDIIETMMDDWQRKLL